MYKLYRDLITDEVNQVIVLMEIKNIYTFDLENLDYQEYLNG